MTKERGRERIERREGRNESRRVGKVKSREGGRLIMGRKERLKEGYKGWKERLKEGVQWEGRKD